MLGGGVPRVKGVHKASDALSGGTTDLAVHGTAVEKMSC